MIIVCRLLPIRNTHICLYSKKEKRKNSLLHIKLPGKIQMNTLDHLKTLFLLENVWLYDFLGKGKTRVVWFPHGENGKCCKMWKTPVNLKTLGRQMHLMLNPTQEVHQCFVNVTLCNLKPTATFTLYWSQCNWTLSQQSANKLRCHRQSCAVLMCSSSWMTHHIPLYVLEIFNILQAIQTIPYNSVQLPTKMWPSIPSVLIFYRVEE